MVEAKIALKNRAMLVHLRMQMWTGRKKDDAVARTVTLQNNADDDAGAWWTYLVPKKALDKVNQKRMACRAVYFKYTLPWMDGGLRILPAAKFMEYNKAMREAIAQYDEAVEEFLALYPELVRDAQKRLGKLLKDKKLPTAAELRPKFAAVQDILPIPDEADFRMADQAIDEDEIRQRIQNSVNEMTSKSMRAVWDGLVELIDKIETKLKDPEAVFRNTLIGNLQQYCQDIPNLNLTDDPALESMRTEVIQHLAKLDPETLRQNKRRRAGAVRSAKKLKNKISDYLN